MTLQEKIETAQYGLQCACEALLVKPADPAVWRLVCTNKARLVALLKLRRAMMRTSTIVEAAALLGFAAVLGAGVALLAHALLATFAAAAGAL